MGATNVWSMAGGLLGGIGLFLLGMWLMTDGLKLAAGPALERILARSTQTRLRGLASGVAVTALVQSSSAVTVAAIGFVNAGLLTLGQSIWVLFGANVGTTMTGWLVALVGLKFNIDVVALPLVGVGMALRLSGAASRRGALGLALAGFGVLFIGIDMLKNSFSGLSANFTLPGGDSFLDIVAQVLVGTLLTMLMQSSSASLTIALTAAQGGLLTTQGAAAVAIGANIGTTVTALIAAIGATPNAKRAAAAHILFNVLTGAVALALLPWLVSAIGAAGRALGLGSAPAANLALFHTAFNLLGVALIWPIADRMTHFLQQRFRAAEDDEAMPRYLDANIATVPALALEALEREIRRMGSFAVRVAREAMAGAAEGRLAADQRVVARLNQTVADFISRLSQASMSEESAWRLPHLLRVARYYEATAELALEAAAAAREAPLVAQIAGGGAFFGQAAALLTLIEPEAGPANDDELERGLQGLKETYQDLKAQLLAEGAQAQLPVAEMDARLRAASAFRRAVRQAAKAIRLLEAETSSKAAQEPPSEAEAET